MGDEDHTELPGFGGRGERHQVFADRALVDLLAGMMFVPPRLRPRWMLVCCDQLGQLLDVSDDLDVWVLLGQPDGREAAAEVGVGGLQSRLEHERRRVLLRAVDNAGRGSGVIYCAEEDSAAFVLKPRLQAANADLSRCFFPVGLTEEYAGIKIIRDVKELSELIAANERPPRRDRPLDERRSGPRGRQGRDPRTPDAARHGRRSRVVQCDPRGPSDEADGRESADPDRPIRAR